MTNTDCAICCEEVTAITGRSVMSCGHEFHMRCIVQWLQKPDGSGNCPCCRAVPGEMERLVSAEDLDSDSDSESDSDTDADSDASTTIGLTPLMDAILADDLTEVERLIAEGANLEEKDSDGDTALYCAVISDKEESAAALVAAGADITVLAKIATGTEDENDRMSAALLAACECNILSVVTAALARGANPNYAHPKTGITPLMEAVRSADQELVDLLLAKGATLTAVDSDGWNVFMWFADSSCDIYIMKSLLSAAGSMLVPREEHAGAAKKIQTLWRGWTVRRVLKPKVAQKGGWFMDRMMTVV